MRSETKLGSASTLAKIPVMEIFGPTLQGEGMAIGRKTMFVRTGGCDFQCVWCDSKFTWDGSQKALMMTPEEILRGLRDAGGHGFDYVTLSGGNPGLIGAPMAALVALLHSQNIFVGLETQGSRWQDWFLHIDDLTLSPKPPSSGMDTDFEALCAMISKLSEGAVHCSLKIVIFDLEDYAYASDVHQRWPDVPMFLSVGNEDVREEGDVAGRLLDQLQWLTDIVIADASMLDVRVLPQLHVLLWGNKRGV